MMCSVALAALHITIALGDVVEFEILPPGTAAWLCTKDKYNYQCSEMLVKPKQKPNSEPNAHCCLPKPPYCQTQCCV